MRFQSPIFTPRHFPPRGPALRSRGPGPSVLGARPHGPLLRAAAPGLLSRPRGSHGRQLTPRPARSAHRAGSSATAGVGAARAGCPSAFQQRSSERANPGGTIGTPQGLCSQRSAPYHFHRPGDLLHGNILIRARRRFQQTVSYPGSPAAIRTAVWPAEYRGATFQILCNATPCVLHDSKTLGPLGVLRKPTGVSLAHSTCNSPSTNLAPKYCFFRSPNCILVE